MQQTAHIVIDRLGVTFSTPGGPVTALQDISLTIKAGQFVALVGPSGSGKSTLLRAIGGLIAPSTGSITVGGVSAERARLSRQVSFVFQQSVLLPWHTAQQNVELPLRLFGWSKAQREATARQFLELVGLSKFAAVYPHQLSGGMQQRVSLARALSFEPAVLLMDEPFGALDEITRERMNVELLQIWSKIGATIIFVTHSLSEAAFLADRVVVLSAHPGRVIADTTTSIARPRTTELFANTEFLAWVAHLRQQLNRSYANDTHL
ncbi:MAG: ABC transporter ATP-binding protein [Chloroflexaceae bacterium]|nr:ABC transporter ATP-binding protein [Chloroflexaceae bacterium]